MPTQTKTAPEAARRAWHRATRDLPDLPYKVETDAKGNLILSPSKPQHGFSEFSIGRLVEKHIKEIGGQIGTEVSVETAGGIKVPDVVWISAGRSAQIPEGAEASPVMPELCVEVLSESNTEEEMAEKRRFYFEAGAEEVWTCSQDGQVRFYSAEGELEASRLAPDFPASI